MLLTVIIGFWVLIGSGLATYAIVKKRNPFKDIKNYFSETKKEEEEETEAEEEQTEEETGTDDESVSIEQLTPQTYIFKKSDNTYTKCRADQFPAFPLTNALLPIEYDGDGTFQSLTAPCSDDCKQIITYKDSTAVTYHGTTEAVTIFQQRDENCVMPPPTPPPTPPPPSCEEIVSRFPIVEGHWANAPPSIRDAYTTQACDIKPTCQDANSRKYYVVGTCERATDANCEEHAAWLNWFNTECPNEGALPNEVGATCLSDRGCVDGLVCNSENVCALPNQLDEECHNLFGCESGLTCVQYYNSKFGSCKKALGESCETVLDCANQLGNRQCLESVCTEYESNQSVNEKCNGTTHLCGEGLTCNMNNKCKSMAGYRCTSKYECAGELECESGVCKIPLGGSCSVDGASGGHNCSNAGGGVACRQYNILGKSGFCLSNMAGYCEDDSHCNQGNCISNSCSIVADVRITEFPTCGFGVVCPEGYDCSGVCKRKDGINSIIFNLAFFRDYTPATDSTLFRVRVISSTGVESEWVDVTYQWKRETFLQVFSFITEQDVTSAKVLEITIPNYDNYNTEEKELFSDIDADNFAVWVNGKLQPDSIVYRFHEGSVSTDYYSNTYLRRIMSKDTSASTATGEWHECEGSFMRSGGLLETVTGPLDTVKEKCNANDDCKAFTYVYNRGDLYSKDNDGLDNYIGDDACPMDAFIPSKSFFKQTDNSYKICEGAYEFSDANKRTSLHTLMNESDWQRLWPDKMQQNCTADSLCKGYTLGPYPRKVFGGPNVTTCDNVAKPKTYLKKFEYVAPPTVNENEETPVWENDETVEPPVQNPRLGRIRQMCQGKLRPDGSCDGIEANTDITEPEALSAPKINPDDYPCKDQRFWCYEQDDGSYGTTYIANSGKPRMACLCDVACGKERYWEKVCRLDQSGA